MWTVDRPVEEFRGLDVDRTYPRFQTNSGFILRSFIHGCFLVFTET